MECALILFFFVLFVHFVLFVAAASPSLRPYFFFIEFSIDFSCSFHSLFLSQFFFVRRTIHFGIRLIIATLHLSFDFNGVLNE